MGALMIEVDELGTQKLMSKKLRLAMPVVMD